MNVFGGSSRKTFCVRTCSLTLKSLSLQLDTLNTGMILMRSSVIATLHAPSMCIMAAAQTATGTGADLGPGEAIGFIVEGNGAGKHKPRATQLKMIASES